MLGKWEFRARRKFEQIPRLKFQIRKIQFENRTENAESLTTKIHQKIKIDSNPHDFCPDLCQTVWHFKRNLCWWYLRRSLYVLFFTSVWLLMRERIEKSADRDESRVSLKRAILNSKCAILPAGKYILAGEYI